METITLQKALVWGQKELEEAHIADAFIDAWYLMEYCFNIKRADYFLNQNKEITIKEYNNYRSFIHQRLKHIPLQYITKTQEFMGLLFHVNEFVLIPRQDTEVLVEEVIKTAQGKEVLDLCTGTGCIIISLAKLCRLKKAVGVDISKEALKVAKRNAEELEADVSFIESDLFVNVEDKFDYIVSNPPYIASSEIESLMPEVRDFEPRVALDGKEDGLYFYKEIINNASKYLKPNGSIFFEIGYDQGEPVAKLLKKAGFREITIVKDLAGLNRVVKAIIN